MRQGATAAEVAGAIDAAERAVREAEPIAQVIYLEPDIYRAGLRAGRAAGAAGTRRSLSPSAVSWSRRVALAGRRGFCVGLDAF